MCRKSRILVLDYFTSEPFISVPAIWSRNVKYARRQKNKQHNMYQLTLPNTGSYHVIFRSTVAIDPALD